MAKSSGSHWWHVTAAIVVAVLALSLVTTGVMAQDEATPPAEATPPPGDSSSPEEPATADAQRPGATAAEKARLAADIQSLTDVIALAQADRDAVASLIDPVEVDGLLAKATELRDAAQATLATDDVSTAPQVILAGMQAATAARALLEAELSAYGLPSQQGHTSHVLVGAYYAIDEATELAGAETDANAVYFVETAQRLYARAYEQYNAGAYAQAERTALVAQQVAVIGGLLLADVAIVAPDGKLPGDSTSEADARGRFGMDRAGEAGVPPSDVVIVPAEGMPPAAIDGFGSGTVVGAPFALTERGAPEEETVLDVPEPVFE